MRKVRRAAPLASWIPGFLRGSFYEVEAILRRRRQQFMAASLQDGLPISGIQVGTVNPLSSDGVVATQEQVNVPMNETIHAVVPGQGQTLSTPSVALEDGSVHSVSASVQQGSSSLTVVRWITRLNEYLAAAGTDRVWFGWV